MRPEGITVDAAFVAYAAPLYRYIYSKVGQAALAEDLTSIVFLKAIRWLRQGEAAKASAAGCTPRPARPSPTTGGRTVH